MGEQVAFADIAAVFGGTGSSKSVDDVLNKQLVISNVELKLGQDGEQLLYIYTSDGLSVRTGSKVLIKQAVHIKKQTDAGNTVAATIIRGRGKTSGNAYYTFA